jgi:NADPH:quinone reductase-like Zn-dependent oxidoreductase
VFAIQIAGTGGPRVLRRVELPTPPVGPGEVLVRVSAAGVNFADLMMRVGLYPEAPRRPFVPGYEVAGVVEGVGTGIAQFHPGDRVVGVCRFGGYSSEIALPASQLRRTPDHLGDVEAAAIPLSFMTAWIALNEAARVRAGERVLVPGAAGGLGIAAVQIAALAGARVTGLVGSDAKRKAVLARGATEALTYLEEERRRVRPAHGVEAWDVILEPRGGARARASYRALAPGGRLVCVGVSSMMAGRRRSIPRVVAAIAAMPWWNPIGLQMANRGVMGLNLLTLFDSAGGRAILERALDATMDGFARKRFAVVVARTFPLAEAGAAHDYLLRRENIGKVVLTVP